MRWLFLSLLFVYTLAIAPEHHTEGPSDAMCKAWAVYDEARGEGLQGQRAVLDAVEAREAKTGKTACELIRLPKQFSGYYPYAEWNVTKSMLTNYWEVATMPPIVSGCTHFHAMYVKPRWANKMKFCKRIGKHLYYKEK